MDGIAVTLRQRDGGARGCGAMGATVSAGLSSTVGQLCNLIGSRRQSSPPEIIVGSFSVVGRQMLAACRRFVSFAPLATVS
jgi:hypothetical protein